MTDKEIANRLRELVDDHKYGVSIDAVLELIDELDPPKVDRSLRGPVMVTGGIGVSWPYIAGSEELATVIPETGRSVTYTWDEFERYGWTVRKLTLEDIGYKVRRWDEWTETERDEYRNAFAMRTYGEVVDSAIDTALKETPNA